MSRVNAVTSSQEHFSVEEQNPTDAKVQKVAQEKIEPPSPTQEKERPWYKNAWRFVFKPVEDGIRYVKHHPKECLIAVGTAVVVVGGLILASQSGEYPDDRPPGIIDEDLDPFALYNTPPPPINPQPRPNYPPEQTIIDTPPPLPERSPDRGDQLMEKMQRMKQENEVKKPQNDQLVSNNQDSKSMPALQVPDKHEQFLEKMRQQRENPSEMLPSAYLQRQKEIVSNKLQSDHEVNEHTVDLYDSNISIPEDASKDFSVDKMNFSNSQFYPQIGTSYTPHPISTDSPYSKKETDGNVRVVKENFEKTQQIIQTAPYIPPTRKQEIQKELEGFFEEITESEEEMFDRYEELKKVRDEEKKIHALGKINQGYADVEEQSEKQSSGEEKALTERKIAEVYEMSGEEIPEKGLIQKVFEYSDNHYYFAAKKKHPETENTDGQTSFMPSETSFSFSEKNKTLIKQNFEKIEELIKEAPCVPPTRKKEMREKLHEFSKESTENQQEMFARYKGEYDNLGEETTKAFIGKVVKFYGNAQNKCDQLENAKKRVIEDRKIEEAYEIAGKEYPKDSGSGIGKFLKAWAMYDPNYAAAKMIDKKEREEDETK